MKIIFMGTPEFALPSLQLLYYSEAFDVMAVITQPDRPAGRGNKLQESPVKKFAKQFEVPFFQPEKIRKDLKLIEHLKSLEPDAFVTAAFGQILSKEILDIPRLGTINLHASLLPKYRGPNPIQWAIINGDTLTGITTMLTEEGVDTGPILIKQEIPILAQYDTNQLSNLMANAGSRALADSLRALEEGSITPMKQDDTLATRAPKLKKEVGNLPWTQSTWKIHNLIRGTKPWPGAYTYFKGELLKVHSSSIPCITDEIDYDKAGMIKSVDKKTLQVYTGDGYIDILEVQPPGKPVLNAGDWARGARLTEDDQFTYKPEVLK